MTTDELAATIKAKYPDYAGMDNQTLVERITTKYPEYKQHLDPTYDTSLGGAVTDSVKSIGSSMMGDTSQFNKPISSDNPNPVMASLSKLAQPFAGLVGPSRLSASISQPGQIVGEGVKTGLGDLEQNLNGGQAPGPVAKGVNTAAGLVTSVALDPQSYATPEAGEALQKGAAGAVSKFGDAVNEGLAKLSQWKLGASVPEKAADIAAASKFQLPTPTQEDIETGVSAVQKALSDAKDKAGAVLNKAKADIGIPVTIEDKEASLLAGKGTHGLGKDEVNSATQAMLDAKTPEDLASNIAQFKQQAAAGNSDPKLTARVANALQDKINQFVDWQKGGSQIEGVLKSQYKDLGNIVTDNSVGLQGAKGNMSKVLDVFDDLKDKLGDTPGKAETFLRGLFTKDTPANRAYLDKLGQLEHMSGKPVLSDLFKQFAGESFDKLAGSPKLASAAAAEGVNSLVHLNPYGVAGSAGYLAAQSPSMIKMAGQTAAKATELTMEAVKSKLAKAGLTTGLVSLKNDRVLQSIRDTLKNNQ